MESYQIPSGTSSGSLTEYMFILTIYVFNFSGQGRARGKLTNDKKLSWFAIGDNLYCFPLYVYSILTYSILFKFIEHMSYFYVIFL